ncbi:unnamed protein product [Acanthoscelides obtectus]
MSCHR